ncbi:hypothetical protein [Hymenobacter latericus]|uniref:hypothetical protein n=1 Tax=Hymenobacter sp. YIM 151858-1 TaxID=2987688 RepID=UPI002227F762|nr:hypothetical protein [Hymenobacter sp. YIM 151858-1]UYZ58061.1 hypothetical protein OIS50_13450 [Hymenobacter sp. YIM 151858-1]
MLHAIRNNKAGRNFQDAVNWRALFGASEDSLTSSVFGHLFYLPANLLWEVLCKGAYNLELPCQSSPEIISYEFWPRWDATYTANTYSVEPDVFVRTSEFDLIIEAKRHDYGQQNPKQWRDQVQAYFNEYGCEKNVFLLAVGGIDHGDEQPTHLTFPGRTVLVYKCRWRTLLGALRTAQQQLPPDAPHLSHLLKDLIAGFGLHGYATNDWLATMPGSELTRLRQVNGLQTLLSKSSQF